MTPAQIKQLKDALNLMLEMHEWRDIDMIHHNKAELVRMILRELISEDET